MVLILMAVWGNVLKLKETAVLRANIPTHNYEVRFAQCALSRRCFNIIPTFYLVDSGALLGALLTDLNPGGEGGGAL